MRPDVTVTVTEGRLAGVRQGELEVFLGVPYAAPPTGERRWTRPQRHGGWAGVRDASVAGPAAPQADVTGSTGAQLLTFTYPRTSEDCLTLNIWAPARRHTPLPVMVFIHGGAFVAGSGCQPIYAGDVLAERGNVVVVTLNYRLGLLGWLRSAELGSTGNEGWFDQLAALQWVQREIAAFGGDPGNVTVFGQSAGGASVAAMLAAGRTPFRRAVLQSGAANLIGSIAQADATLARLTSDGQTLNRADHVDALNELQNRVTPRRAGAFYRPVADGVDIPTDPLGAIAAGSATGVDLLVGATEEEYGFFVGRDARFNALDDAGLDALIRPRLGDRTADAIDTYRTARTARGADCSARSLAIAMLTDAEFRVPALQLAEAHRGCGAGETHAYLFGWRSPMFDGTIGSAHVLELPFLFATHRHPNVAAFVGDDRRAVELSNAMIDAWAAFARGGDPGWPAYRAEERLTRRLGPACSTEADPLALERAVWMAGQ